VDGAGDASDDEETLTCLSLALTCDSEPVHRALRCIGRGAWISPTLVPSCRTMKGRTSADVTSMLRRSVSVRPTLAMKGVRGPLTHRLQHAPVDEVRAYVRHQHAGPRLGFLHRFPVVLAHALHHHVLGDQGALGGPEELLGQPVRVAHCRIRIVRADGARSQHPDGCLRRLPLLNGRPHTAERDEDRSYTPNQAHHRGEAYLG